MVCGAALDAGPGARRPDVSVCLFKLSLNETNKTTNKTDSDQRMGIQVNIKLLNVAIFAA